MPDELNFPTREQLVEAANQCACFNFRKATRAVTKHFDEALAPTGLRSTQLIIMVVIGANESATLARLQRELQLDASTLTRSLKPLQRDGLIKRDQASKGRRLTVSLTKVGQDALSAAIPHWIEAQDRLINGLGAEAWTSLQEQLARAVDVVQ